MEILNSKVKDSGITEDEKRVAIMEIEQLVKNKCNIIEIPDGLIFVIANMAADLLRWENAVNTKPDSGISQNGTVFAGAVSSVTEGDTSVSFSEKSAADSERENRLKSRSDVLDDLILNYREQLWTFRKVKW